MEDIPDDIDEQTLIEIGIAQGLIDPEGKHPKDAVDKYLTHVGTECVDSTVGTYEYRLADFVEWCDTNEIESTADLTTEHLEDFYRWRRQHRDLSPSSLQSFQRTLKRFIRYCCQRHNWVRQGLHETVDVPNVDKEDRRRENEIPHEVTQSVISYLDKYEPYRCEHVVWTLLGEAGLRRGSLRALDVGDFLSLEQGHFLRLRHRPETGTRLKNGNSGERTIQISRYAAKVIEGYLDGRRNDVEDEYGRKPLLAPGPGRISESTIQKYAYRWSQPCQYAGECPRSDRDPETCRAAGNNEKASHCPINGATHAVRKGYITQMRREGFSKEEIEHRCDVSEDVVDDHYDMRNEVEKAQDYYGGDQQSLYETTKPPSLSASDTPPAAGPLDHSSTSSD